MQVALIGVLTVIVVAFGGYMTAKLTTRGQVTIAQRVSSGEIATTDAQTLWQEASSMRVELREQVETQGAEILRLNVVIGELRERVEVAERRVTSLERKVS